MFQEVRPGAGFETGDFVTEKLGGATVERLCAPSIHCTTFFRTYYLLSLRPSVGTIYLIVQRSFSRYYVMCQTYSCHIVGGRWGGGGLVRSTHGVIDR